MRACPCQIIIIIIILMYVYSGTPLSGQIEPVQLLRGVCNRYNMWLHVTGSVILAITTHTIGLLSLSIIVMDSLHCVYKRKEMS